MENNSGYEELPSHTLPFWGELTGEIAQSVICEGVQMKWQAIICRISFFSPDKLLLYR